MADTDVQTKRNALTETLLANARKSLNEVSRMTNIPTKDLAELYANLFEERGWLTDRQEERLLLIELADTIADAKSRLKDVDMKDYASVARVVLTGMTLIANRMDNRKKLVDDDINRITLANAKQFGAAYDIALTHIVGGLRKLHPEITNEEIDDLNYEGLERAKKALEQATR